MCSFRKLALVIAVLGLFLLMCGAVQAARKSNGAMPAAVNPIIIETNDKDLWWLNAKEIVYKHVQDLIDQNASEIKRDVKHSKFAGGNPNRKWIAITFDDGPHPAYTPKILSILKKSKAKATFFVVGMMAEQFPDLVRAEIAGGNSVGNHTYHHVNLTKIPEIYVASEIKACGQILQAITGTAPHLFRPPGGDYNDAIAATAEKLGYTTILWTDDPGDYASPGTKLIDSRTIQSLSNGGIILIHDGVQQTIDLLPSLIKQLRAKGFELVTIDEMMGYKTAQRTTN